MSQAGILNRAAGPLPPSVPLQFTVDEIDDTLVSPGIAIPAANNLYILGDNGLETSVDPDGSDGFLIRFQRGFLTTTDATPTQIFRFTTITDTCITFRIITSAVCLADSAGAGGSTDATIRNIGGTATLVNTADVELDKDTALSAIDIVLSVAGADFIITVTGIAGKTINWSVVLPGITSTLP